MIQLNDDCIYEVCQYLNLADLISLSHVNVRLKEVVLHMIFRPRFGSNTITLSSDDSKLRSLELLDFKRFFKVISSEIYDFTIKDTSPSAFTSYLQRFGHRPNLDFFMGLRFNSLVHFTCEDEQLNDSHMGQLANTCKLLQTLRVSGRYLTGRYIETFECLQKLEFRGCNIQEDPLQKIVSKLPIKCFKMLDNRTDVVKALAEAKVRSIEAMVITDPNFGVYFAEKSTLKDLLVFDHPENLVTEKEGPVRGPLQIAVEEMVIEHPIPTEDERIAVRMNIEPFLRRQSTRAPQIAAKKQQMEREDRPCLPRHPTARQILQHMRSLQPQAVERQPVQENLADEVPIEEVPVEQIALVDEQEGTVKRLRLYPHLSLWFARRIKCIEVPREVSLFESLARIVTQWDIPSTDTPSIEPAIAMFRYCRRLKNLKIELHDYECSKLEKLTDLCVKLSRPFRLCFYYREGRKANVIQNIKKWQNESRLFQKQKFLEVEFIPTFFERPKHIFHYIFF